MAPPRHLEEPKRTRHEEIVGERTAVSAFGERRMASTFFAMTLLISSTDPGLSDAMVLLSLAKRKRSPFELIPLSARSPSFRSIVATSGAYVSPITLPVAFAPTPDCAASLLPGSEPLFPHANTVSEAATATEPSARSRVVFMRSIEKRDVDQYRATSTH